MCKIYKEKLKLYSIFLKELNNYTIEIWNFSKC